MVAPNPYSRGTFRSLIRRPFEFVSTIFYFFLRLPGWDRIHENTLSVSTMLSRHFGHAGRAEALGCCIVISPVAQVRQRQRWLHGRRSTNAGRSMQMTQRRSLTRSSCKRRCWLPTRSSAVRSVACSSLSSSTVHPFAASPDRSRTRRVASSAAVASSLSRTAASASARSCASADVCSALIFSIFLSRNCLLSVEREKKVRGARGEGGEETNVGNEATTSSSETHS